MNKKTVVCLDLDDVLTGFMKGFAEYHNSRNEKKIDFDKIKTLNIAKLLGVTQDEAWPIVESYYQSEHFDSLTPYDGVIGVIKKFHNMGVTVIVITYRHGTGWKKSHEWLKKHFGHQVKLVHGMDKDLKRMNKGKICRDEGVSFILEDCLDNAIHCLEEGVKPFLLTAPWNIDRELPNGIIRVDNHEEFFSKVKEIITS